MKFPSPSSADAIVAITDVSRRFGDKTALRLLTSIEARATYANSYRLGVVAPLRGWSCQAAVAT